MRNKFLAPVSAPKAHSDAFIQPARSLMSLMHRSCAILTITPKTKGYRVRLCTRREVYPWGHEMRFCVGPPASIQRERQEITISPLRPMTSRHYMDFIGRSTVGSLLARTLLASALLLTTACPKKLVTGPITAPPAPTDPVATYRSTLTGASYGNVSATGSVDNGSPTYIQTAASAAPDQAVTAADSRTGGEQDRS